MSSPVEPYNNRCILICSSSPRKEWDFYVFAPNGQRFRSTVEIQNYVENNPNVECDLEVTNTFRPENFQKKSSPMKKGRSMKKYNGATYLGFFSSPVPSKLEKNILVLLS